MTVRIEHDLPGNREIFAEAYWGIHASRAVENFKISNQETPDVPQFVRSMVVMKRMAAQTNGELGVVKPKIAATIEKACDEVLFKGRCLDQFPSDVYQGGAGTLVNVNTNKVIANLILEISGYEKGRYDIVNPMDHMNANQPIDDAYPIGFRLVVYYSVDELLEKLALLKDTFTVEADELKDVLKMGRIQLQDAVPMTAGQKFRSFQVSLEEEILNLGRMHALLLEANLGATTIGTGVNMPEGCATLVAKKLSKIGGLDCRLTENLVEATSDYGAYMMVHSALKRTVVKLSKICNDSRFLSSDPCAGLKEINLPEMQTGSSTTSVKVNPAIPEVVSQIRLKVIGDDTIIAFITGAGQLQLNMMEPVVVQCMFETISPLDNTTVNPVEKCVKGITVNREICERYVFNFIDLVTYPNPYIGHSNDDLVGKTCTQTGKDMREVILERDLLSEAELDRILSPENLANLHWGT